MKKYVEIRDNITDVKILHNLTIIPFGEREKVLKYYHGITGHKNYLILHEKILSEGYYWKNLIISCKKYIKDCDICTMKNRTDFVPPPSNQILCNRPKELYLIDLTELPSSLLKKYTKKIYILSLLDHFSKYAGNYILYDKEAETVLNKIKEFIKNNGKPERILTDNGSEFINKKFKKFCKKNYITLIHGRARHPQTQGTIERYNCTIKDYIKTFYIENERTGIDFSLENVLNKSLDIYNNSKHSTTGFSPKFIFSSNDENLFAKIKKNTIKSQLYIKRTRNIITVKDSLSLH